ncbi:hypothetical protein [Rhodococcus sp. IEGM 1318]|uniref:hypothetical protein n=1 Tax=Rhodococcus sp. IEGM 1318 TaxID=3082226 RepID=UPI0029543817|nr:hypothetical protein [Rhodococcus sp. IEGM 1318]MDV8004042.1 hypothetical protein [Rhodococcus sp. IEGM 1318]
MDSDIKGKIAEVVNLYTVLINRGTYEGVLRGSIFAVMDPNPIPVIDPDTKDQIGERFKEKIRVKVVSVDDHFCTAETYRRVTTGGEGFMSGITLPESMQPRRVTRETISSNAPGFTKQQKEVTVNVGDVVQLVDSAFEGD